MTTLQIATFLILALTVLAVGLSAYSSFQAYRISRISWDLRMRVIEIESEVAKIAAGTEADRFTMFLADVCTDEKLLNHIHLKAQASRLKNPDRILNVDRKLQKAFGALYDDVSEAFSATAEASSLISSHSFLRLQDVEAEDLDVEKYVLFRELTKDEIANENQNMLTALPVGRQLVTS